MQFCRDVIDQTSIVELVSEAGGKLKHAGRHQMLCSSPLRNEKDASFRVYVDQNSWYDYGAQIGGDPVDFVQALHGVEFNGAIDILGDRLGKKWGDGASNGNGGGKIDPETEEEITRLVERRWVEKLSTDAALYYHSQLTGKARLWLKDKYGFTDETIDQLRIGWADGSLLDYMCKECDRSLEEVLKTGLFIRTEGGRIFELHESRITFPYWRGATAPYMISRRVDGITPDTVFQKAKYKKSLTKGDNHPYVSRHVRNDILYGEDSAKRKQPILVCTEGVTDAISAIQCGWPVISPVTVRFKKAEIERVLKISEKADVVVILNDNEEPKIDERTGKVSQPGFDGAADTAKVLFEAGRDVRIGVLPRDDGVDKVDLNSYVKDHGDKALDAVIRGALTYPEFLIWRAPVDTRPVELDEVLAPAYQAIAGCTATQREAYINQVCDRFKLTHGTVVDSVAEFMRARMKIVPPAPPAATSEDGALPPPPTVPGGEDGGSGSVPPDHIGNIKGAVEEDTDGYYFINKKTRKGDFYEERISNFVLDPKKLVRLDDGQRICCDVRCVNGMIIRDVIFPDKAFRSSRDLKGELQRRSGLIVWNGEDANVGGVIELIMQQPMEEFRGVPTLGYVEVDGKARWVLPDYVLGPDGRVIDSNIIYAPIQQPGLADCIDLSGAELSDAEIRVTAQRILPKVFQLNTPDVILPLLGWFCAAAITPIIREMLGHMAILWIWGSQGSGKTSIARDIFWRLCAAVRSEPFSCTDTVFTLINVFSCTSSTPVVYDEFKLDMPQKQQDAFLRMVRKVYSSENEKRGRPDLRVVDYKLAAPVCVIGEMLPEQPAILERIVCVSPLKHLLDAKSTREIASVASEPLHLLGAHYIRFVLGRDLRKDIRAAQDIMDNELLPTLKEQPPPRIRDNLLIVVIGDYLHRQWCDQVGVKLPDRPQLKSVFKQLIANITESEDGGGVKDAFDHFIETLSTYAHLGIIRENVHYAVINGMLCIHLESCYQAYLVERRRANQPDVTNGLPALKRVIREKHAQGGYIVKRSHTVRFGGPDGGSRQVRALAIDPDLIPEHVSIDQFPVSENRTQGGAHKPFTGWDDK